jgi:hypothetical protein
MTSERRHDIDWLRVVAIGLLLIYHIAIIFQPWAMFIGFIKSEETLRGFMDTHDHAKCLANSTFILRIRNGTLFRHAQTELEAIVSGTDKTDFVALHVWYSGYCTFTYIHFSKIL